MWVKLQKNNKPFCEITSKPGLESARAVPFGAGIGKQSDLDAAKLK